jgi:hypothetical protein
METVQKDVFSVRAKRLLSNSDNIRTFAKEERTLSDPEDKGIERNSFKERPDVPASHRIKFYPYSGQSWHPNFGVEV